jgi:hypothetical protein
MIGTNKPLNIPKSSFLPIFIGTKFKIQAFKSTFCLCIRISVYVCMSPNSISKPGDGISRYLVRIVSNYSKPHHTSFNILLRDGNDISAT